MVFPIDIFITIFVDILFVHFTFHISHLEPNNEYVFKHSSVSCACDGHKFSVYRWAGDYLNAVQWRAITSMQVNTGDYFSVAGDYLNAVAVVEREEDEEELGGGGHSHK